MKYRLNEHKRKKSALALYTKNTQHKIDFEKFKILDIENNQQKRLFSEMWQIHKNNNNLNRQLDTQDLKDSYKNQIKVLEQSICNKKQ